MQLHKGGNMPSAKKARTESYGDHKGLAGTGSESSKLPYSGVYGASGTAF